MYIYIILYIYIYIYIYIIYVCMCVWCVCTKGLKEPKCNYTKEKINAFSCINTQASLLKH